MNDFSSPNEDDLSQDIEVNAKAPKPKGLNKNLVFIAIGFVAICVIGIIYTSVGKQSMGKNAEEERKQINNGSIKPIITQDLPTDYANLRQYNINQKKKKKKKTEKYTPPIIPTYTPEDTVIPLANELRTSPSSKADETDPRLA